MAVPKIIAYDVELRSVNPVRRFERPKAYTNDLNSVEFQFKILDMTSTDLETATAITLVYMRDGSFFANPATDVTRVGNVFSYLLKENEGNHAGVAQIQLVVTVDGMELASQLFDFEIVNGLETKVAQEVMIYDWTILTRDARAYIDQFVADEVLRDAQFDNAQFDRNVAFVGSQDQRAADFGASQTAQGNAYTAAEAARDLDFGEAEALRAAGYDADHSRADTDHTRAENDSTLAGTDHTRAESDSTLAGTDHTRAETDHTRADADSATVAGFNTRLTAEETATANNKISAVKGKTFADVDARFEDVEVDTTMMGTNIVMGGDFSNGSGDWYPSSATIAITNGEVVLTPTTQYGRAMYTVPNYANYKGHMMYLAGIVKTDESQCVLHLNDGVGMLIAPNKVTGAYHRVSANLKVSINATTLRIILQDPRTSGWTNSYLDNVTLIDLTAAFGAGNEPTAEQMDGIMAKFTNSWFDGTKNLFRANATLNKLMAVDARTEFETKNGLVNGDMTSGTAGWSSHDSTLSASGNTLSAVGLGAGNIVIVGKETQIDAVVGNKLYIRLKTRIPNVSASSMQPYFNGTNSSLASNAQSAIFVTSPVINQYYTPSAVVTVPSGVSGKIRIANRAIYPDATTALNSILETQYTFVIDLTATFGAGKEPTLAEMDRLMARFPNSWFDGVKPIQTIETLYREKAEKYQEPWIAPTLLNAWINIGGTDDAAGYMKDSLGFVHLKGIIYNGVITAGTVLFTLPAGYRPSKKLPVMALTSGGVIRLDIKNTGEVSIVSATSNSWLTLNNLTFRAEV